MNREPRDKNFDLATLNIITTCCICIGLYACDQSIPEGAGADWAHYLGHPTSNQYSNLDQINRDNVDQLELAWTYVTGDSANYQTNNLIVDGQLYTATPV